MSFRTVVIKNRAKLDLKMNYLVCRAEEEIRIFIPEISFLILESTAISLTSALLSELVKNNVKIIFCDEKHNPESELCSYYGNYNCSKKIMEQLSWNQQTKDLIWSKIIKLKIEKQMEFLNDLKLQTQSDLLRKYLSEVKLGDETNREGHAAKVYFNSIFQSEVGRRNESFINGALNYGYAILLSCFNREIVKNGYLTQLGIWHCNEFNQFNFSCDIMEPFRILIDKIVVSLEENEKDWKFKILNIFNKQIKIDGKLQFLENAISIYCRSIFNALNNADIKLIRCYE